MSHWYLENLCHICQQRQKIQSRRKRYNSRSHKLKSHFIRSTYVQYSRDVDNQICQERKRKNTFQFRVRRVHEVTSVGVWVRESVGVRGKESRSAGGNIGHMTSMWSNDPLHNLQRRLSTRHWVSQCHSYVMCVCRQNLLFSSTYLQPTWAWW